MYDVHSRPGMSYGAGFLILIGTVLVGLFIGSLLAAGVWMMMTHQSVFSMEKDMMDPKYADAIRILQLVSTFFIFFIPAWITANILNKKPFRFMGFNFYFSWKQLALVVLIMLVSMPLVGALSEVNKIIPIPKNWETSFKALEDTYAKQVKVLSHIAGFGDYIVSMVIMALAPAIFEEALFRGGMQNLLQRMTRNPWISIGITSIIFSAIHFSYYGFIPRVALGVVLGLIYYYSGSLWLSIFAHFFNNAMVVTEIYYYTKKGLPVEDAMNESFPIWWGFVAVALLVLLFIRFRKNAEQDRKTKVPAETVALEDQWMT